MNFFQNFEETKEKEYYECTDTMAQMKNKNKGVPNLKFDTPLFFFFC